MVIFTFSHIFLNSLFSKSIIISLNSIILVLFCFKLTFILASNSLKSKGFTI
ncbi:hypothetical protein HOF65_02060 [bacterium]|nr:hypothetical protein [bacterium]